MTIGDKLRNLRIMSKKTLKEQSEIFGVSLNSVYRWEHGLTMPKRSVLKRMSEYYEVPLLWLLQESDDEGMNGNGNGSELYASPENGSEQKLLKMYRKLPESYKYKILGYVERVYVEALDELGDKISVNNGK